LLKTVKTFYFEALMIIFIIISTVQLASDNPLIDENSTSSKALYSLDKVSTVIFSLESIMKIIAFGFWGCGSQSYMRNAWNVLDLIVVIVSVRS
jgi:Ion transport protein